MGNVALARFMVNAALPVIDGYVRIMVPYSVRQSISSKEVSEFADGAAPRFVDLIVEVNLIDESCLKQSLSIEVKKAIISILNKAKK